MATSLKQDRDMILWFIRLRWIAGGVAIVLIFATIEIFGYLDSVVLGPLLALVSLLFITNVVYTILGRRQSLPAHISEWQIAIDLVLLTAMLHFSGGIENPLSLIYLFHVILSGILLKKKQAFAIAILSFALYTSLATAELMGVIGHYTLDIFPHSVEHVEGAEDDGYQEPPSAIEVHEGSEDISKIHASHYPLFVISMCALCLFLMLLTAYFVTTIMERLRRGEQQALEERQRLEHVLNATGAGLLILDANLQPLWQNKQMSSLAGVGWAVENQSEVLETLADGHTRSFEKVHLNPAHEKRYFQITVAALRDEREEITRIVQLIQDITTKKLMEAEVLHTARMATLGTMAAGIAHEVGNPLASIATRLQLLAEDSEDELVTESLPLLHREIGRIERIVHGISQFGRAPKSDWGLVDLNIIATEVVELLRYDPKAKKVQFNLHLEPSLPQIRGIRDQLKQILLNLGLNAIEAMPEGGQLEIVTTMAAGEVNISVKDTGIGVDFQRRQSMFKPFVTSKEKGSGLGLFVVDHFVSAHGGTIVVDSDPGVGTAFKIVFPVHETGVQGKP